MTPFAFGHLKKQLDFKETHILENTTVNFYQCGLYKSMKFLYKHTFKKRKEKIVWYIMTNCVILDELENII